MFGYLPELIKQQVIFYLENDNFRAAKEIYDTWVDNNRRVTDHKQ